jgi:hypothetical protein
MGDHDKQVSWLAAWCPFITFPAALPPVVFDEGTPLTVAGAARAFNPSSLKSPVKGNLLCLHTLTQNLATVK